MVKQARPTMIRTFIKSYDTALDGGIPREQVVLIAGCPGTMKSSLAYFILHQNIIEHQITGCYITLEQSIRSLMFQMKRMGLKGLPEHRLALLDVAKLRKHIDSEPSVDTADNGNGQQWLEVLKKHLRFLKTKYQLELLVIDSLPVLELLAGIDSQQRRKQLFLFFEWLRDRQLTALIISETPHDPSSVQTEEFLADAIFQLQLEKVGPSDFQRRIRCAKLRGVDHNTGFFTLEFKNGRFIATRAF